MNKRLSFVLPALVLPFMLVGCNPKKTVASIEVDVKNDGIFQVGESINKEDITVTIIYDDESEKELKNDEWTSKTNLPYQFNSSDKSKGYKSINVTYGNDSSDFNVYITPYFKFDYINVSYDDDTQFSVPLYNDDYSLKNKVTYEIYGSDKDIIEFYQGHDNKNLIKLKNKTSSSQKDSVLYALIKNDDGTETLIDGCTIKAKNSLNSNVTVDTNGNVDIKSGAGTKIIIPTISVGKEAKILASNADKSITSIELPGSIEKINKDVFKDCSSLVTVDTSNDEYLTTIEDGAFSGCTSLKSFCFPALLKSIGANCFNGCSSLETLTLYGTNAFDYIGAGAFTGCSNNLFKTVADTNDKYIKATVDGELNEYYILDSFGDSTEYKINSSCKIINCDPTGEAKDWTLEIPEGVEVINSGALANTSKLTSLSIPSTVTTIGKGALQKLGEKEIKFANYKGWYYIDGDEVIKMTEEDMKTPTTVVSRLATHDLYWTSLD